MGETTSASLSLSDPKLAAGAIAAGGKLLTVRPSQNGRLDFIISGVPADFTVRVMNDEVQVSLRSFIEAMNQLLGLIAAHKRGRL